MEPATVTLNRLTCTTVRSQVAIGLGCWLVVALFLGEAELLRSWPLAFSALMAAGGTAGLVQAYRRLDCLHRWLAGLDVRWLLVPHLARAVRGGFLVLAGDGRLPSGAIVVAGWCELAVAAGAALMILAPPGWRASRRGLRVWNLLGLLVLAAACGLSGYAGYREPQFLEGLVRLPLSLFPTFVVPLLLFTHGLMLLRITGGGRETTRTAADCCRSPSRSHGRPPGRP